MSIRYLGQRRTLDRYNVSPIAQLINVPQLQGCQRCQFCIYWERNRNIDDYNACSEKNHCSDESLLFAELVNNDGYDKINNAHFSPTAIIKQTKIDNAHRYLQYWTADIQGYECNRLCQFYPSRIADEKSVADCSNTNACGRNGSFYDLLEIADQRLLSLPQFYNNVPAGLHIMQWNGEDFFVSSYPSLTWDDNGFAVIVDAAGISHHIINMMDISACAGNLLHRDETDPAFWLFDIPAIRHYNLTGTDFVLRYSNEWLYSFLRNAGLPAANFNLVYKDIKYITWGSTNNAWFTSNSSNIYYLANGDNYLVCFQPIGETYKVYCRFGTDGTKFLGANINSYPPSRWRKIERTVAISSNDKIINLTSRTGQMSTWLMSIGVRESLFYTF